MKVLCASLPGPGHCYPMLAVARALVARGHAVTLATGTEHAGDAARAGCALVDLPPTPGSPLHALRPYEDARALAQAFAPAVRALDPDVAVVDLITLGAALAVEVAGVPWATLSIHGLHTPSRDLPPFGWGKAPARGPMRLRDAWMRRSALGDLARARGALNEVRAQLGLPPTDRLDGQLSPDLILLATLPALELPRDDWPHRAHVVGPCLWDPGGDAPTPAGGDGPLVLVALSTAHGHRDLLERALGAVAACRARAIVTTGKSEPPPLVPRGAVVSPFASHDSVLPRCDAVVCNGGHGVVARALTHGVPLVVIPGHGDQRENGYRVARAGAGVRAMRPRALGRAVRAVLTDPRYREGARRIAAEAAAMDGPARAADLLEMLAARRRSR